jgi:hypothetical protein
VPGLCATMRDRVFERKACTQTEKLFSGIFITRRCYAASIGSRDFVLQKQSYARAALGQEKA